MKELRDLNRCVKVLTVLQQGFPAHPLHGRAGCSPMAGALKPKRPRESVYVPSFQFASRFTSPNSAAKGPSTTWPGPENPILVDISGKNCDLKQWKKDAKDLTCEDMTFSSVPPEALSFSTCPRAPHLQSHMRQCIDQMVS